MADEAKVTVLVVDDDEVKRFTMTHVLSRAGFYVVEAETGGSALEHVASRPDVVILDVKLPDMSGFDVCRRIKENPATSDIPVLHVSATFVESEDRVFGLESGADGYLTDIVNPMELIATVRALLRARRAEDAARLAANQWQATFDAIGDGVCLLDDAGAVARSNRAAGEVLGLPGEDLAGRAVRDLLPIAGTALEAALAGRRRESAELTAGGRALRVSIHPVAANDHGFAGMVCIVADVTERRRAERALRETEEHFRLLVEGVRDYAIVMTDPEGRVVSWNTGAERILGYAEGEILGRPLAITFTPEDRAAGVPEREMRTAVAEGRATDERWHLRRDGGRFWASGVLAPLRDEAGRLRGFAKVFRDDTERKRLEEELRRRAAELVDADRQKDRFLAMLAHELRNPLAPIRNALEEIRLVSDDASAIERARAMAGRQIAHMARLIEDLLDVSRITSGKVRLRRRPLDLAAVVAQAAEASRPTVEANGQEFRAELPPGPIWVEGDPTRIEQVLANLLNNATKYTDPGGRVGLSARVEGGEAVVRVADTGIGLGPEMLTRAFDLFAQDERSLPRTQGGLGIGLTLVRSLVEMHGGSVAARSGGPGLGSEFLVRLPVVADPPARADEPAPRAPADTDDRPRRVLVVDDNVDSARSLARVLELWGHLVRVAHDGPEAIAAAAAGRPDLVLLDLGLPGMNGYEIAERLLAGAGAGAGRPVLAALTGFGQDDDRRKTREVGFDHHLVKPVDLDDLQALILRIPPRDQAGGTAG